jgi:hypothetical protein
MGHLTLTTFVHSFVHVLIPMLHPLPTSTTRGSTLPSNIPLLAHTSLSLPTTIGVIVPTQLMWTLPESLATARADTLLILPTWYAKPFLDGTMPNSTFIVPAVLQLPRKASLPSLLETEKSKRVRLPLIASYEVCKY